MPVASVKSGAIFEKRLIEAYISQHGKDPVSGEELEAADLIDLKCMAFPDEVFPFRLLTTAPPQRRLLFGRGRLPSLRSQRCWESSRASGTLSLSRRTRSASR